MVVIIKNGQVYDKQNGSRLKSLDVSGVWSYNNGVLATLVDDKILVQYRDYDRKCKIHEVQLNQGDGRWIKSVWADEMTTLYLNDSGSVYVYDNHAKERCMFDEIIREKDITLNMLNNLHIDVSEDYQVAFSYNNVAYKATYCCETTWGMNRKYFDCDIKPITCPEDYQNFVNKGYTVIQHNGNYMSYCGEHPNQLFSLKYGIYNSKRVMLCEDGYVELEDDEHPYFESEEVINRGKIIRTKSSRK